MLLNNSVQPHRQQPTRLPHPWDSPGKNTGVGCHFLLQCVKVKSLSRVRPSATPWTAAYQAPPSMGFSRQEYWSGAPLPSPATTKPKSLPLRKIRHHCQNGFRIRGMLTFTGCNLIFLTSLTVLCCNTTMP